MKNATILPSIASAREPVVPVVPAVDLAPSGRLPYAVVGPASEDATANEFLYLAAVEMEDAATSRARVTAQLTASIGHIIPTVRALAAELLAANPDGDLAALLDEECLPGGGLREVLEDACRAVVHEQLESGSAK